MSVIHEANGWKYNIIPINSNRIILVGDNKNFDNSKTDFVYSYTTEYADYKGLKAMLWSKGRTKEDALEIAKREFEKAKPYSDGSNPFMIVADLKGELKWCVFSGNLNMNEYCIEKKHASKT